MTIMLRLVAYASIVFAFAVVATASHPAELKTVRVYEGLGGGLFSPAMNELSQRLQRCKGLKVSLHSHSDYSVPEPQNRLVLIGASAGGATVLQVATDYKRPVTVYTVDPVKSTAPVPPNAVRHVNWRTTVSGLGGGKPQGTKIDIPSELPHLALIGSQLVSGRIMREVCDGV